MVVHLKVLVVVRVDAETGDEAVHHQLHVGVLAARAPPEGFGRVEEQSLMGTQGVSDNQGGWEEGGEEVQTFRSMTMGWTRRKMVE